jgi:hypothetical protein
MVCNHEGFLGVSIACVGSHFIRNVYSKTGDGFFLLSDHCGPAFGAFLIKTRHPPLMVSLLAARWTEAISTWTGAAFLPPAGSSLGISVVSLVRAAGARSISGWHVEFLSSHFEEKEQVCRFSHESAAYLHGWHSPHMTGPVLYSRWQPLQRS